MAITQSLNLATLNESMYDYYREYAQGLREQIQYGFVGDSSPMAIDKRMTIIPAMPDEMVLGGLTANNYLRQYNPADTSGTFFPVAGAVNPDARIIKSREFKGDLEFKDNVIETTFLLYQQNLKTIWAMRESDAQMSFLDFLFMDVIIKKALRTLRKVAYQGVYNAAAAYSWVNIMDGLEAILAQEIAGTGPSGAVTITPHAYNSSNSIVTEIETAFDTLSSEQKRAEDLVVLMREDIYSAWIRANRFSLGRTAQYDSEVYTIDGYPNARVLPDPDLVNYKAVIYEKSNLVLSPTLISPNSQDWEFQRFDRLTKMMLNGKIALQLWTCNPVVDGANVKNVAVMS